MFAVGLGDVVAFMAIAVLAVCILHRRLAAWVAIHITLWSGSLSFLLVHAVVWWYWTRFVEPRPYELLTMILSLEAIVLSSLTMLGMNLLAQRHAATPTCQCRELLDAMRHDTASPDPAGNQ